MKYIVVDTNKVFSALLGNNKSFFKILFNSQYHFIAPNSIIKELSNHKQRIYESSTLSAKKIKRLLELIFFNIVVLNDISQEAKNEATKFCVDKDPDDIPFVALAIEYNALYWTGDKKIKAHLESKGFYNFFYEDLPDEDEICEKIKNKIKGSPFVREVKLDSKHLIIQYIFDFQEKKKKSSIKEDDYNYYFGTGKQVDKIMIGEPIRILKDWQNIHKVSLTLPFEGKFHEVTIERKDIYNYFNSNLFALKDDNDKWVKFVDKYVYKINNKQRDNFIKEFVKIVKH